MKSISKFKNLLSAAAFSLIAAFFLASFIDVNPGLLAISIYGGTVLIAKLAPMNFSGSLGANGFLPYLLMQSRDVFQNATPSKKVTPRGTLRMLLSGDGPESIVNKSSDNGTGHFRNINIKYRQRLPAGQSSTTDDCAINAIPVYKEQVVPATRFRKFTIHLDDATIGKYEEEASKIVSAGNPVSDIPMDLYNSLIEAANGLFADINADCLTDISTIFGVNVNTGSAAARACNFPLATTSNPLTQGMTMVSDDIMANEIRIDDVMIVGAGLINNYYTQQPAKSADFSGLDTNQLILPKYYYDPDFASVIGANKFGVFEKNALQLLNINRFDGFRRGDKVTTILGTITLPVVDFLGNGELQKFKFDFQIKYIDCPTTMTIGGVSQTVDRGWAITLMSSYAVFGLPNDSYATTDRLYQSNGTLLYTATNS